MRARRRMRRRRALQRGRVLPAHPRAPRSGRSPNPVRSDRTLLRIVAMSPGRRGRERLGVPPLSSVRAERGNARVERDDARVDASAPSDAARGGRNACSDAAAPRAASVRIVAWLLRQRSRVFVAGGRAGAALARAHPTSIAAPPTVIERLRRARATRSTGRRSRTFSRRDREHASRAETTRSATSARAPSRRRLRARGSGLGRRRRDERELPCALRSEPPGELRSVHGGKLRDGEKDAAPIVAHVACDGDAVATEVAYVSQHCREPLFVAGDQRHARTARRELAHDGSTDARARSGDGRNQRHAGRRSEACSCATMPGVARCGSARARRASVGTCSGARIFPTIFPPKSAETAGSIRRGC